jgi:hypothetical protein
MRRELALSDVVSILVELGRRFMTATQALDHQAVLPSSPNDVDSLNNMRTFVCELAREEYFALSINILHDNSSRSLKEGQVPFRNDCRSTSNRRPIRVCYVSPDLLAERGIAQDRLKEHFVGIERAFKVSNQPAMPCNKL